MIALKTVYNNVHKFLTTKLVNEFEFYEEKYGYDVFEQTQGLVFMAIHGNPPSEKYQEIFGDAVYAYNHIKEYKEMVDKTLANLERVYKDEIIDLGNKTADANTYFRDVKAQLESGDFDFSKLGTPKKDSEMTL